MFVRTEISVRSAFQPIGFLPEQVVADSDSQSSYHLLVTYRVIAGNAGNQPNEHVLLTL